MNGALVRKTIRDARAVTFGVAAAFFLITLLTAISYAPFAEQLAQLEVSEELLAFFGGISSIATPEGYYVSQVFAYGALLLAVIGIVAGTAAVAGEESAGTLDLLLAQPVRRRTVLFSKALGIFLALLVASVASLLGFAVAAPFTDLGIGLDALGVAHWHMLHQAALFSSLALLGSAALPTRAQAAVLAAGAMVILWVGAGLAAIAEPLSFFRHISPFAWTNFERAMLGSGEWKGVGLDLGLALAFVVAAAAAFERRDVVAGPRERERLLPFRPRRRAPAAGD